MIPTIGPLSIDYYERHLENKICRPILPDEFQDFDPKAGRTNLAMLVDKMTRMCGALDAYAVAAPQVGAYIRLAVVTHGPPFAMINPVVLRLGGNDLHQEEACLSLPPNTAAAKVVRCSLVEVEYTNMKGVLVHKTFTNLMARIVQHEIDHLDGCFFINRVGPVARDIVLRQYRKFMRNKHGQPTTA